HAAPLRASLERRRLRLGRLRLAALTDQLLDGGHWGSCLPVAVFPDVAASSPTPAVGRVARPRFPPRLSERRVHLGRACPTEIDARTRSPGGPGHEGKEYPPGAHRSKRRSPAAAFRARLPMS